MTTKEQALVALDAFQNKYVEVIPNPPLTCDDIVGTDNAKTIIAALEAMSGVQALKDENEKLRELLKMARATGSHTATRILIDEALGENHDR